MPPVTSSRPATTMCDVMNLVPVGARDAIRAHACASNSCKLRAQSVRQYGYNSDTLKVTINNTSACLRLYQTNENSELSAAEHRIKRAMQAFAAHGLAPAVYAAGNGWSLEPWLGPSLHRTGHSLDDMRCVGQLLAALHNKVHASWFEESAQKVLLEFPTINKRQQTDMATTTLGTLAPHAAARLALGVAAGAQVGDTTQIRMLADTCNGELLSAWASGQTAVAPRHPAATRLVTVHGDAHDGNIVRVSEGVQQIIFVDLEAACVARAVHDLAQVLCEITAHKGTTDAQAKENERAFLEAYLHASGFPTPHARELQALVLDCRLAHYCSVYLKPRNLPCEPTAAGRIVACVHAFAEGVRSNEDVCRHVVETPHCATFFAKTLGVQVHELGGLEL